MASRTIAFALGALFCHQLAQLPDVLFFGLAPLLLPILVARGRAAIGAAFLVGLAWTGLFAQQALEARVPATLQGFDLTVTGIVEDVPARDERRIRFVLRLESVASPARQPERWNWRGCRVRLSWYTPPQGQRVRAGERWRAAVRLRQIRGLRNPGGHDAEHRALRDSLCASGYLRPAPPPLRLDPGGPGLDRLRAALGARIDHHLDGLPARGIVRALAVGLRDQVAAEQYWLLQATGTAHLMAISGLHIGLVAGLGMLLGVFAARRVSAVVLVLPAAHWGALTALGCAASYAALAGFSVPTQRALFMLMAFLAASLARRRCARSNGLALALAGVLLPDPMAVWETGTWLSFAAVAGLLWALPANRGRAHRRPAAVLRTAVVTQLTACAVLFPLAVLCFSYQSLAAPLANLLAVPVTGLLAVPLILIGLALDAVAPQPGGVLLRAGAHVLGVMLEALQRIPGHDTVLVPAAPASALAVAAGLTGVALLLSPLRARVRLLGVLWLTPLALPPPAAPPPGGLTVQVLDVGQGLATLVRTSAHVLVFDAGPRWSESHDAGAYVVAPALRREGVSRVDRLLISHHHADHAGGVAGLTRVMPVAHVQGDGGRFVGQRGPCQRGQSWSWDGYRFRVLHPAGSGERGNNASCVLHVSGPGGRVLLPADIEAPAEARLVESRVNALAADLLLIPHHGSRTSSTSALLDAVRPSLAVNSSGHRNRFRLPAREVISRYRSRGIRVLDTACDGAVRIELTPGAAPATSTWRQRHLRFWHTRDMGPHCMP